MAVVLYRSNRSETLVDDLCQALADGAPDDPFALVPIVVGSRGMERWLRHEIATRRGVTGRLAFPFPRQAFDGTAAWLLRGAPATTHPFWESPSQHEGGWSPDALTFRSLLLLRTHLSVQAFQRVDRYLDGRAKGPVDPRELAFAREVADTLDRMLHDRPDDALDWAHDPNVARDEHRWLAVLLQEVGAATDDQSPARLHLALREGDVPTTDARLYLFGLSTLGPGDRARLAWLSRSIEVHLFLLAPSQVWWADVRSKSEQRRALAAVKDAATQERLEAELAEENPLLSVLGMPSRDIQVWLEDLEDGYREADTPLVDPADSEESSLLSRLQDWVSRAGGFSGEGPWPPDDSISLLSSFGPLRQCEVLRDELLALFAADESLEPRHVCVMTPDIETYAPLVSAVFARRGLAVANGDTEAKLPAIPTAVSDLGLRRTNPVAEVLLQLLTLAGERLTADRLLDFLSLEALRERFDLSADDLADLRDLVRASGMCWGLDASDRKRFDQPERDQNTARFAIERLALGVLMPEADSPVDSIESADPTLGPAVPLPVESRDRVARVGKLAGVVRHLAYAREQFASPRPIEAWCKLLRERLDALTETSAKGAWLRAEVDASLDELAEAAKPLEEPVEREALTRWLRDRFEIPQRGDRPITGAVTVCALEPMRSVPFEVVVLLGMDDGTFPRGSQPRAWDPFSEAKGGERDRRAVDRHLLLEALLCARKRFMVLWSGRDIRSGEALPAAVPIEELIEVLGRLTGASRQELVRQGTLQPWSRRNYDPQIGPTSHDARMGEAARRTLRIAAGQEVALARGLPASGSEELPPEEQPPRRIDLDTFASDLHKPQRMLLRDRLGLRLATKDEQLPEREPLELDHLDEWSLRNRVLPAVLNDGQLDDAWVQRLGDRLAGEGLLPLQAGGERVLTQVRRAAEAVATNLEAVGGVLVDEALPVGIELRDPVELELGGVLVRCRQKDGRLLLEWPTASKKPNDALRLKAWVHVLAAAANGKDVAGARLVGTGTTRTKAKAAGEFIAWHGSPTEAREKLADLAVVWRLARHKPAELFGQVSPNLAELLVSGGDLSDPKLRRKAQSTVRTAWEGGYQQRADRDDPWVAPCFFDYDPTLRLSDEQEEGLVGLARRVWVPIKQAIGEGEELAITWVPEGGAQ